ncbi:B-cell lymphoma 3 protein homolog [Alosa sapidissima]|uniref:B-cell lymphoma 3 protein homolog n=1 Tax=Alosa sapidissima TaxID=34773 RepID=UPI001C08C10E|nr:B-cell lymphoma 3 protein homolog [Alosa sapidissima]XP_041962065.1 B-cell lymphoma 3 protein homolog [Alosa sapidissima]
MIRTVYMPQIMTMSCQQTLSAVPLDLRTSTRGRESNVDNTASDSAEVKAEIPVNQQDCINGSRTATPAPDHQVLALQMTPHLKDRTSPDKNVCTNNSDSAFVQVRVKPELVADNSVAAKSQDASTSRLPFRKRPYPGGSESPAQSSPFCSKDSANGAKSPKLATNVLKTTDHYEVQDAFGRVMAQDIISGSRQLDPLILRPCALAWSVVPHGPRAPPAPWQVQMERLHADVALATQQDDDGDTPLHIAVVQGQEQMVHRLIHILKWAKKDVDIYNNMRQTPLHLTVITGNVDLVKALLRADADPGALDRNGQTTLHLCCEYNQASCLSVILSHPSGSVLSWLETRNYEGLSPLHLAVQSGNQEPVKLLLKNGADINAVDNKSGRSPLMHAVEANSMEMVNLLIECGCDVNAQSYSGNTALHSACGRGYVEAVRTLLKNGADSSLKNYHNDTAVMVAKNKRVTDVLRGKGSRTIPTRTDIQSSVHSPQHNTSLPKQFNINGSASPRLVGCLPVASQHTGSHSPFTPVTHSPLGPAADGLSSRQSSVEVKERVLLQKNLGHHSVVRENHFSPWTPQSLFSFFPGYTQQLSSQMPPHSVYPAGLPGLVLPSGHPPQIPFFPRSQIDQSRSSSRSSDQSDVSTMSVNSDSKGESCLD